MLSKQTTTLIQSKTNCNFDIPSVRKNTFDTSMLIIQQLRGPQLDVKCIAKLKTEDEFLRLPNPRLNCYKLKLFPISTWRSLYIMSAILVHVRYIHHHCFIHLQFAIQKFLRHLALGGRNRYLRCREYINCSNLSFQTLEFVCSLYNALGYFWMFEL